MAPKLEQIDASVASNGSDTGTPKLTPGEFFLELSADDSPFSQTKTIDIYIKGRTQTLTIQSVPITVIQEELAALRPRQPRGLRGRDGRPVTDDATLMAMSPDYAAAMRRYIREFGYSYILHGTQGLQLRHGGEVVWSADGKIRDRKKAGQELENMGMPEQVYLHWYTSIRDLGAEQAVADEASFLGEYDAN